MMHFQYKLASSQQRRFPYFQHASPGAPRPMPRRRFRAVTLRCLVGVAVRPDAAARCLLLVLEAHVPLARLRRLHNTTDKPTCEYHIENVSRYYVPRQKETTPHSTI